MLEKALFTPLKLTINYIKDVFAEGFIEALKGVLTGGSVGAILSDWKGFFIGIALGSIIGAFMGSALGKLFDLLLEKIHLLFFLKPLKFSVDLPFSNPISNAEIKAKALIIRY